jgi:hypothetical protein
MDDNKNKVPAETRTPIGDIKATITFQIDGLKELKELTEALSRFQEKGLTVNYKVNP